MQKKKLTFNATLTSLQASTRIRIGPVLFETKAGTTRQRINYIDAKNARRFEKPKTKMAAP